MPQPIIRTKNLDITYNLGKENEFKATKDLTMDIYPGEYIAFFGPSGCGKSTIMYSILGILEPSAGELYVKGENPYTYSPDKMVHFQTKTIGIIYQAFFLINSLSVTDNVALPQTFMGVSPSKRKAWARHILTRFGLKDHLDKYPEDLSGGQMQRVSVARSMVNRPDIVLADEPTGNLDSVSTKQVMNILLEINEKEKRNVILITHNAAQLMYAHRVFYMKDGHLDRIVPNPERKQIAKIDKQKTMVTEMDQLSKIFPYDNPVQLKVKSLVNYLTQNLNYDKLTRLEEVVAMMVERKVNKNRFEHILCDKFEIGGVGLSKPVAKIMADRVSVILKKSEDVRRYRRRFEQNQFFSEEPRLVNKLTKYILEEYSGDIRPYRLRLIRELVRQRVSGFLRQAEFLARLSDSEDKKGGGFNKKSALNISNYFEKLIAQGIKIGGKH